MRITKRVGVRRFQRKLYSIVKGGFPLIIMKRNRPMYMLTKVGERREERGECDMCRRERICRLSGIHIADRIDVKWICRRCEGRLRAKGVIII